MKRRNIVISILAIIPTLVFAKIISIIPMRTKNGFKVNAGEARFGKHYKMKGVTQNMLDIKISGNDTENDLAVFEQTGLSPNGGPPLHIHPFQDEWFYVIEGEYLFQVGEVKYQMKARMHRATGLCRFFNMGKIFGLAFILTLLIAINLAMFIGHGDFAFGITAGFLAGFGWVALAIGVVALFENRSLKYVLINGGYMLVAFSIMGAILGAWK